MKKALLFLAAFAALVGAFFYGFVGRERRWFPYYPLRAAYRALKPAPVPHRYAATAADTSVLAQREAVGALTQLPTSRATTRHPARAACSCTTKRGPFRAGTSRCLRTRLRRFFST